MSELKPEPPPNSPEPTPPARKRRGRATPWPSLLASSDEALFVLDRHLRLRYVNRAWERLIGQRRRAVYRLRCVRRRSAAGFQRVLAPPPEALSGSVLTVRRTPPNRRHGPPWWDITFLPLLAEGRLLAIIGKIAAIAAPTRSHAATPHSLPAPCNSALPTSNPFASPI
jgi:PAS domain-containing protein